MPDFAAALGRPERVFDLYPALKDLRRERVLVTGAAGMIGSAFVKELREWDIDVLATDISPRSWTSQGSGMCVRLDITSFADVLEATGFYKPTLIVNTAAQKLAVLGEENPWQTLNVSVNGVQNLLNVGRRVIHASTCKAADPEVAYGIGKAAAEKLVLHANGTVVRFYNVVEAGPSVYDIWRDTPEDEPLPITPCTRHMISLREAVSSLIVATSLPSGRYAVDPGPSTTMRDLAWKLFPGRKHKEIPPRRGDRRHEPLHADCEQIEPSGIEYLNRIVSAHDPVPVALEVAA